MTTPAQKQLLEAARLALQTLEEYAPNLKITVRQLKRAIRAVEAEQQLAESFPNLVKEKK